MGKLAVGFRFRPTDEELIGHYLRMRNKGLRMPEEVQEKIVERPMYGDNSNSPWNLLKEDEPIWEEVVEGKKFVTYVFCKHLYKADTKKRFVRMAGCGTWEGKAGAKKIKIPKIWDIEYFGGESLTVGGERKSFTFKPKKGKEKEMDGRGKWTMQELSLVGKQYDYVVCKVTRELISEEGLEFSNQDPESSSFVSTAGVDEGIRKRQRSYDMNDIEEEDQIASKRKRAFHRVDEHIPTDVDPSRNYSDSITTPIDQKQDALQSDQSTVPIICPSAGEGESEDGDEDWLAPLLQESEESHDHQNLYGSSLVEENGPDVNPNPCSSTHPLDVVSHDNYGSSIVLPSLNEVEDFFKLMDGVECGKLPADQIWNELITVEDYLFTEKDFEDSMICPYLNTLDAAQDSIRTT